MKNIIIFFCLFFLSYHSFARETCIRLNNKILCGAEVSVKDVSQKNTDDDDEDNKECVEGPNGKVCGIDCKKNIWGADCRKSLDETCIEVGLKGVICGYHCVKESFGGACASKEKFSCILSSFGDGICGKGCKKEFGEFKCSITDKNAKYLK